MYCLLVLSGLFERFIWVSNTANDTYVQIFLTLALFYLQRNQLFLTFIAFNISLSFKVGGLMWLPGIMFGITKCKGILVVILFVLGTIAFQILITLEFLIGNSKAYLNQVFPPKRDTNYYDASTYYFLGKDTF